jgi:hypothetical protein
MKRRTRWWHAALSIVTVLALAAGCDWWRQYDNGFYRDNWDTYVAGWKGADGIISVPLPNLNGLRRTLWLFGDTHIYKTWQVDSQDPQAKVNQVAGNTAFTQAHIPRNTIGIQSIPTSEPAWTPPVPNQITYYATDATGGGQTVKKIDDIGTTGSEPNRSHLYSYAPRSQYPLGSEAKRFKWPTDGIRHAQTNTNIFWHEFVEHDTCVVKFLDAFAMKLWVHDGTYIERIMNAHTKNPEEWSYPPDGGRFSKPDFKMYNSPAGSQPVAIWGIALRLHGNYVHVYGHAVNDAALACQNCTDPFDVNTCSPTGATVPDFFAKNVVMARAPLSKLRVLADWEFWWPASGVPCNNPAEGCTGGSTCWCRQNPTHPNQLRVVATQAANYFSVDRVNIGGDIRYVMVQGDPGLTKNIGYARIGSTPMSFPALPAGPPWPSCSAEPCTYPFEITDQSGNPGASPELSFEAVKNWVNVPGNERGDLFLFNDKFMRINHTMAHGHLSHISGVKGDTNNLLVSYWMSHFWPGNIPNAFHSTCHELSSDCWSADGSWGGKCRWDTEVFAADGGRCLDDPCTQKIQGFCGFWDNCEVRGGICRARPTQGGPRFMLLPLNDLRPWCEPNCS